MLSVFMVSVGAGWGAYNEVLVVAESSEEAFEAVQEEALTDDMYGFFKDHPESITVSNWGPLEKGILYESGADC